MKPRSALKLRNVLFILSPTLIIFVVCELAVRLFIPQSTPDPYLQFTSQVSIFSEIENPNGKRSYRVTHPEAYKSHNLTFPVDKPPNTFRIFSLGGSANAGWPHGPQERYTQYLAKALQRATERLHVEVLNVSAHAWASYRVREVFDDIVAYDPDLIIVYSGNNEFLEPRDYRPTSVPRRIRRFLVEKSHLVRLIDGRLRPYVQPPISLSGEERERTAYEMWSKVEQVALELRKDPDQFESVLRHYEFSIDHMAQESSRRGIPLLLLTVPVNLRDWHPNVSQSNLESDALDAWQIVYDEARRSLLTGSNQDAVQGFEKAIALDPQYAHAHFYLARAYDALGAHEKALSAYELARDLDRNPFRALGSQNRILHEIAARYPEVFLVDVVERLFTKADFGIPGFDLFLDYVHPSKRGNLAIAEQVFESIRTLDLIPLSDGRFDELYTESSYRDTNDIRMQTTLLSLFTIMHQYEAVLAKAPEVLRVAEAHTLRPETIEFIDQVVRMVSRYVNQERQLLLQHEHDRSILESQRKEDYRRLFHTIYARKAALDALAD